MSPSTTFCFFIVKTNRFCVAVGLYSKKITENKKCDTNISDTLDCATRATLMFSPYFNVVFDLLPNWCTATCNLFDDPEKMVNLINIKVNFCLFIQEWAKQIYLKCSKLWEKDNRRITRKRLAWNLMKLRVWDITQWIHKFLLELTKFLPFPIWQCHMALTYTTPQIHIMCSIYTFYGFILGGIPRGCQNIFHLYFHANFYFIKYNTIENNYSNIVLECNVQFVTG